MFKCPAGSLLTVTAEALIGHATEELWLLPPGQEATAGEYSGLGPPFCYCHCEPTACSKGTCWPQVPSRCCLKMSSRAAARKGQGNRSRPEAAPASTVQLKSEHAGQGRPLTPVTLPWTAIEYLVLKLRAKRSVLNYSGGQAFWWPLGLPQSFLTRPSDL